METGPKLMPTQVAEYIRQKLHIDESQCIIKRIKYRGFLMGNDAGTAIARFGMPTKFPFLNKIAKNPTVTMFHGDDHEYPGFKWFLVTVDERFFFYVQGVNHISELQGDNFDLCFRVEDAGSRYQITQLTVYACSACKKLAPHLNACGPCKLENNFYFYCSKECQVADWPAHRQICCKFLS